MRVKVPGFKVSLPVLDIAVTLVSVVLVGASVLFPHWSSLSDGLAASGLFFVLLRGIEHCNRRFSRRKFRKLFGNDAPENNYTFVYPDFVVAEEVRNAAFHARIDEQRLFAKSVSLFGNIHRVDIPQVVAMNDIQSLLEVAIAFADVTGQPPPICNDAAAVRDPKRSFISFGFSSNECTLMYLSEHRHPMFRLHQAPPGMRYGDSITVSDRQGRKERYVSNEHREIGIVMRYKPTFAGCDGIQWWFCAGLGATATIGAGYWLANNWKMLADLVGTRNFIAVLSVANHSHKVVEVKTIVANGHRLVPRETV
jgi:hypothetical protein